MTFDNMYLDVGDIIGVLFRIEHKETFLSKKPKWSLHSISIETCRKLSNEQGTSLTVHVGTILQDTKSLWLIRSPSLDRNFTPTQKDWIELPKGVFRFWGSFKNVPTYFGTCYDLI